MFTISALIPIIKNASLLRINIWVYFYNVLCPRILNYLFLVILSPLDFLHVYFLTPLPTLFFSSWSLKRSLVLGSGIEAASVNTRILLASKLLFVSTSYDYALLIFLQLKTHCKSKWLQAISNGARWCFLQHCDSVSKRSWWIVMHSQENKQKRMKAMNPMRRSL